MALWFWGINLLGFVYDDKNFRITSFFGKDEVFLEKYIEDAVHIEVQILGDEHGNIVHLFERDCSLQRRHQKVIERAPAIFLSNEKRKEICQAALNIAKEVK